MLMSAVSRLFAVGVSAFAGCWIYFSAASATVAQQTADKSSASQPPNGFLQIVFSGGWVGVLIIGVLFALSMTAAYLIIDHLMTVRRKDLMPDGLADNVREMLTAGQVAAAKQQCAEHPSVLSFVIMHGIAELEFGWSSVEKALEDAIAEQSARLFRKVEYLAVIGNIAPMVGLLGTVIGMIMAFQQVAVQQGAASAPQLATGIYQALVTTVGGLIVAIPALAAFAVFRNRVDQLVAEAGYIAQHIFGPLRQKGKRRS